MNTEINPKYDPLRYYTVTGDGVRLRAYPSLSATEGVLGQLYKGDVVENIKNSAGVYDQHELGYIWLYVVVRDAFEVELVGKKGYVAANYLDNSQV